MSFFANAHDFVIKGGSFISVQAASIKEKLQKELNPVMDAYASSEKICLEGTRVQIIEKITEWITSENDVAQLFFLHGAAGTGKSTISHTIGNNMAKLGKLGGFFCFDRTRSAERSPKDALKTIVYNMALHIPDFGANLLNILDKMPYSLSHLSIEEHWEKLIVHSAQKIQAKETVVLIMDGLDESGARSEREHLLSVLLKQTHALPANFRVLLTSRLEGDTWELLSEFSNGHQIQAMSDLTGTKEDIYKYVCAKMKKFIKKGDFSDSDCDKLAVKAEGYFQWAYTVCEALCRRQRPGVKLRKQFDHFMSLAPHNIAATEEPLDKLYKSILENIFHSEDKEAMDGYRKVMSQVLAAYGSLSQASLSILQSAYFRHLKMEDEEAGEDGVLQSLGSLLVGIDKEDTPVQVVHTSIRDFLLDEKRSKEHYIDLMQGHTIMAVGSIKLMTEKLHFNMCNLESSYLLNSEIKDLAWRIATGISTELQYACLFWGIHLVHSEPVNNLFLKVESFLSEFSLYWMEVLSVLQKINKIPENIDCMIKWGSETINHDSKVIQTIGKEILKFVQLFGQVLMDSTPHIYLSSLPFLPRESLLRRKYISHFNNIAALCSGHRMQWPISQVVVQGHESPLCVAFSPDGKRIVSGSYNNSVKIWNAETGQAEGEPLEGHTELVNSVAFSPDGKRIVSGSNDNSVRIWNAETGLAEGEPLVGHTHSVNSVAFSPNGKRIVSGSWDRSVRIWNAETGQAEGEPLEGHTDWVQSVAFSPDGKRIVSGSDDNSVRIWNAETGLAQGEPLEGHTHSVNSVAFSPDGKRVVSGSWDKSVRIWNAETGQAEGGPLEGHTRPVNSVAFSPDGKRIVSGSYDHSMRIWNAETGQAEGEPLEGHTESVKSVTFSPDGKRVVSGSYDNSVRIWNAETWQAEGEPLEGHAHPVNSVAFSPDGKIIVSGSNDNSVRIWNAETGLAEGGPLEGHTDWVHSVAFSPDGKRVVSGSHDNSVRIWNVETGQAEGGPLIGHAHSVNSVAFSPDGRRIVSGSNDNSVKIWNAETGQVDGEPLEGHTHSVNSVAFSPDGKRIVSGSYDNSVRIWNAETGLAEGEPLEGHTDSVKSVAFSPDGKRIVSGSFDKSVRIWNAITGQAEGGMLEGHTHPVNSVAFSSDGKRIVSGSYDNSVRIWNAETGQAEAGPLEGHTDQVKAVAFSSDGKRIVSGSWDNSVRIWNAETGQAEGGPLEWHTHFINSVVFSPDRKRIVSGSSVNAVTIWNAATGQAELQLPSQLFSLSFCSLHPSHYHMHSNPAFNKLSFNTSGWVCGSDSSLFLWIPPDWRNGLMFPHTQVITTKAIKTSLNLTRFVHGQAWVECYTGNPLDA